MGAKVLLVGNASNYNRGCEAIARGTLAILRQTLGADVEVRSGILADSDAVAAQLAHWDVDEPVPFGLRYETPRGIVSRLTSRLLKNRTPAQFIDLDEAIEWSDLVLEVGGDNYSLDYGRPYLFVDLDRKIARARKPIAIWGASVGPFQSDPQFESEIVDHFRQLNGIFVRKSISRRYLQDCAVPRVAQMGDPAIMMAPVPIPADIIDVAAVSGAVGFNFSPFQAKSFAPKGTSYWELSQGHIDRVAEMAAKIVTWTAEATDRPILLAPHVFAPVHWNNDYQLLQQVQGHLTDSVRERVTCLPEGLTAPQIKWAISKCAVFAGSRTHATLAAISSGVPTMAFGYSRKAQGLMFDLYESPEFCIPADEFNYKNTTSAIRTLLAREMELRERIARALPAQKKSALDAGRMLVDALKSSSL